MTWKELKLAALQKMFLLTGSNITTDDGAEQYLAGMPTAAAEGMALISAAGKGPRGCVMICHRPDIADAAGTTETADTAQNTGASGTVENPGGASGTNIDAAANTSGTAGGGTAATATAQWVRYDLPALAPDFYRLVPEGISCESPAGRLIGNPSWRFEGDGTLLLRRQQPGTYRVQYHALPPALCAATPDEYELPLAAPVATLLPLYVASQLYKDDDLSLATLYRNEFEVALEGAKTPGGGAQSEEFTSESGWV